VSAISWPCSNAARNAASVTGCTAAHCLVTAQPWTGNAAVAPLDQVRKQRDTHGQLSLASKRLGQHRRRDLPGLEVRGHLGQRVVRETHS
jgi:hypothetical protein